MCELPAASKHRYETSNGIQAQEAGELHEASGDTPAYVAKRGEYSYTGADGVLYLIRWIADHRGFQPFGDHIPKN